MYALKNKSNEKAEEEVLHEMQMENFSSVLEMHSINM